MRLGHFTYRFFLLGAVSASMFLLMKINKTNFYHHYFKVIEEVEVRNSQEVGLQVFTLSALRSSVHSFLEVIFSLLGVAILSSVLLLPVLFLRRTEAFNVVQVWKLRLLSPYPIRAP